MKYLLIILTAAFTLAACTAQKSSQTTETIRIKTSAVCGMCKQTIEKALAYEKGVKSSNLDVPTQTVEVVYDPSKTNPEAIKTAIAEAGYDADDVPADDRAYERLPDCCKKDMEIHED